jgi:hypothetical protein
LRKIGISFEAGSAPERMDLDISRKTAEFIFGVGSTGLSPLEAKLAGKRIGDTVVFSLDRNRIPALAEHLCRHMPQVPDGDDPFYLQIRIEDIREADNREVVKAMAEMSECGEGCSCGGH